MFQFTRAAESGLRETWDLVGAALVAPFPDLFSCNWLSESEFLLAIPSSQAADLCAHRRVFLLSFTFSGSGAAQQIISTFALLLIESESS